MHRDSESESQYFIISEPTTFLFFDFESFEIRALSGFVFIAISPDFIIITSQ